MPPARDTIPDLGALSTLPGPAPQPRYAAWSPHSADHRMPGIPMLMYFHGTGVAVQMLRPKCAKLARDVGCNVVALEYPGYGDASGDDVRPSEESIAHAAAALFDSLATDNEAIYLVGSSMGTGVAVRLALERPAVRAVILVSPFLSVLSVVYAPLGRVFGFADVFPNGQRIGQITCPVEIVHGGDDEIVPHAHSAALADRRGALSTRVTTVPGASHESMWHDEHRQAIYDAIQRAMTGSTRGPERLQETVDPAPKE